MTIAPNISKALMEITGEPRTDIAILELIEDAVEHRIEKIETEIKKYEDKHHINFEKFKDRFNLDESPESYSYEMEMDFLEWEGLTNRLSKYRSLLHTFS